MSFTSQSPAAEAVCSEPPLRPICVVTVPLKVVKDGSNAVTSPAHISTPLRHTLTLLATLLESTNEPKFATQTEGSKTKYWPRLPHSFVRDSTTRDGCMKKKLENESKVQFADRSVLIYNSPEAEKMMRRIHQVSDNQ